VAEASAINVFGDVIFIVTLAHLLDDVRPGLVPRLFLLLAHWSLQRDAGNEPANGIG
jgi:hypothetical protein